MKIKAMVTKIDKAKGTMVVLTKDRQFKVLPLSDNPPMLGSTIEVSVPHEKPSPRFLLNPRLLSAAAVLLIFLTGLFGLYGSSQASAYVALDMKPSIQLAVNNNGQVTKVSALNEDGTQVVNRLHLKSKDIYQAVQEIIRQAGKDGSFDKKDENLVMAVYAKTKDSGFIVDKNRLLQVINDELKNNLYPGYVVINKIDWEQWQKASNAGYSANRLIMMESARMHGITLEEGSFNHGDMMRVIKKSNISVPRLFPQSSFHVILENQGQVTKTDNSHEMMNAVDNSMHDNQKLQSVSPADSSKRDSMHPQNKTNTDHMDMDKKGMGTQGMMMENSSRGMMTENSSQEPDNSTTSGSAYSNMPHM